MKRLFLVIIFSLVSANSNIWYRLAEETEINTSLGDLRNDAKLKERYEPEVLQQLSFRFLRKPPISLVINQQTSALMVAGKIDRDVICPSLNTCKVQLDIAVEPVDYFEVLQVNVEILDHNDNFPTFKNRRYHQSILEASSTGKKFPIPAATDPDSPAFGIKGYRLEPPNKAFSVETSENMDGTLSVNLVLKSPLDRETKSSYKLKLVAFDGGSPPKSGHMYISVKVIDANDNAPRFINNTYNVQLQENIAVGSRVIQVIARDPDQGQNGELFYSFSPRTNHSFGHLFGIKNRNGVIFVRGNVDYEEIRTVRLVVLAKDMGPDPSPAECTVIITITDQNDHAPHITVNTLQERETSLANAAENAEIGTFVAHVLVKDLDSGRNAELSCKINDQRFSLIRIYNTEYKIVTSVVLDREKESNYRILITCRDRGVQPQIATKHVQVTVEDRNDCRPKFDRPSYSCHLVENNLAGSYVIQVNATDCDVGKNAEVGYFLDGQGAPFFNVHPQTGTIKTRISFDREQVQLLSFNIYARDKGRTALTGSTRIIVHIHDVNDCEPQFDAPFYKLHVPENSPPGSLVGHIHARDKDRGSAGEVLLLLQSVDLQFRAPFSLNSKTGRLLTSTKLDREAKSVYELQVVARDHGNRPLSSSVMVTVYVSDRNDNRPVMMFPSSRNNTITVSNEQPSGSTIGRVIAYDRDEGTNGALTYVIEEGNDLNIFALDRHKGIVTLEQSVKRADHASFTVLIAVSDQGLRPLKVKGYLSIIVNSSIPYVPLPNQSAFSQQSIVIGVAAGTTVIALPLLVAIVYFLWQAKLPPSRKNTSRNAAAAAVTRHLRGRHDNYGAEKVQGHVTNGQTVQHVQGTALNSGGRQVSFTIARSHLEYDSEDEEDDDLDDIDHELKVLNNHVTDVTATSFATAANCSLQKPLHSCNTSTAHQSLSPKVAPECVRLLHTAPPTVDLDRESVHSGEDSNTDSGRGASDNGDLQHTQNEPVAMVARNDFKAREEYLTLLNKQGMWRRSRSRSSLCRVLE